MKIAGRRTVMAASALFPLMAVRQAKAATTDLVVMCDLTWASALTRIGRAFRAESGVRIHVFPTPPGLILPQLARDVQNDIILTQVLLLDRAAQAGLLTDGARSGVWADPLVIAEPIVAPGDAGSGMFAVSELASASGIDGASIVSRMNLPANRVVSAIDNTEVVFLLTTGRARTGLLYLTDVHSGPGLRVVRAIEDPPPMLFAAAVTKLARRPNPAAFIHFMGTPGAAAMLTEVGLDARS